MIHSPQCVFGSAPRSESIAVFSHVRLEDRFHDVPQRALHNAISHRRDSQRSLLFAAELGNPSPPNRLRPIRPVPQLFVQPLKLRFGVPPEMRHGLFVRSRAPAVAPHLVTGALQIGGRISLVQQAEPDPVCWLTRREPRQHALGPDAPFHPRPRFAWGGFSGLFRRRGRHWHRSLFVGLVHHASTFLRPFAPRSLPASALLRTL